MGAWGYGIWDNDTACDIELDLIDAMKSYDEKQEAMSYVVKEWCNVGGDNVILALADLQIDYNVIVLKSILLEAIDICESKKHIDNWREPTERSKVLDEFYVKVSSYLLKLTDKEDMPINAFAKMRKMIQSSIKEQGLNASDVKKMLSDEDEEQDLVEIEEVFAQRANEIRNPLSGQELADYTKQERDDSMIEKQKEYDSMWNETKEWSRDIAAHAMSWKFDKTQRMYYTLVGGERVDLCREWEFNPISDRGDAMDALLNCSSENDYYMNIHKESDNHDDDFLWTVTVGSYNHVTEERKEYTQGNAYLELAICEVLSEVYNIRTF